MSKTNKKSTIVAVSGGFDPIHIGHVRLLRSAKQLGDRLVVILNNDNWLLKKKSYVFMAQEERKEILEAIKYVDKVMLSSHLPNPADMSVSKELEVLKPDIFVNGGDQIKENNPEIEICKKINCKMIFNAGDGGKIQSSSWLLGNFLKKNGQKKS